MNKKSKIMVFLIAMVLALLTVSCGRHVTVEQPLTPEEKKILQRWALKELGKASKPYTHWAVTLVPKYGFPGMATATFGDL